MNVLDYIKNNITYLDGGMGTLLQKEGLMPGELPERWNLTHPEVIVKLQKAYFDAGTNIVASNTFGANTLKYPEEELEKIIFAAIENSREAARQSTGKGEKFVALDIGSLGKLLKPFGDYEFDDAVAAYAKTIRLGAKAGADLIFIETMNDSYDTKAVLLAAKENCELPVFVSNAYGADGKLMTGATPRAMVAMLEGMGADAIGVNCSLGPKELQPVIDEYLKYASVPVLFKPNAGLPRVENGKTVYDVYPEEFAAEVTKAVKKGVRLAGGCCGTTPDYIKATVEQTKGLAPVPITEKDYALISSYTHAVEFGSEPILIGERINPTGKKRFKEALKNNDIDYILSEGIKQQDAKVQVLDVNVGLPDIDEPGMLKRVCYELQAIIDLPLQIDTSDITAMEAALRRYNGKAMINSVNGKEEVMESIFPLVKKYGGLVVCLTLDEDGIPENAEKRVQIAKKIITKAAEYGIKKKDLIFDTLAMTVSADQKAALVTLEALERISRELGCHTSLGVSNISFGLPRRECVTANFFTCALERGLSAAIVNPNSAELMKAYYSFRVLHNMDESCMEYIENIERLAADEAAKAQAAGVQAGSTGINISTAEGTQNGSAGSTADTQAAGAQEKSAQDETTENLKNAILRGRREQAEKLTIQLLETFEPLKIVSEILIPALDEVGKGFEKKTIYLPQLLMSAEASQAAFEKIKAKLTAGGNEKEIKGKFIIATVKGDVHDIGKNIVKLLLENYGFEVIDLGKDVAPEKIVETVKQTGAHMVGLSALMTTTVPAMEETIRLIKKEGLKVTTFVGGAVLTKDYADRIGADHYCQDAMATVRCALECI